MNQKYLSKCLKYGRERMETNLSGSSQTEPSRLKRTEPKQAEEGLEKQHIGIKV